MSTLFIIGAYATLSIVIYFSLRVFVYTSDEYVYHVFCLGKEDRSVYSYDDDDGLLLTDGDGNCNGQGMALGNALLFPLVIASLLIIIPFRLINSITEWAKGKRENRLINRREYLPDLEEEPEKHTNDLYSDKYLV